MYKEISEEEDRIGKAIVNAAFHVHKEYLTELFFRKD